MKIFIFINQSPSGFRSCKRCRPDKLKEPDKELIQYVKNIIHNHFSESLTLSKIAEQIHISPYHLHRTFKRITGLTPSNYLLKVRINMAQQMLKQTDKSITEIASQSDFVTAHTFRLFFKIM